MNLHLKRALGAAATVAGLFVMGFTVGGEYAFAVFLVLVAGAAGYGISQGLEGD